MKKILFLSSMLCLFLNSCRKEVTCTCKDAAGTVVKYTSLKSNKKETDAFKADCEQTKTASFSGTVTVYTPCTVN